MSRLTKYQPSREKDRPWLGSVKDDVFKSHCKACQTNILMKHNGTDKLKQHEKSKKNIFQQWKACLVSHQLYRLMVVGSF